MSSRRRLPYFATALCNSVCPETNTEIRKGDSIVYNPTYRIAYALTSKTADQVRARQFAETFNMTDQNY
ncbi:conserved hypothetical protein [Thiomonas arsenitoxydans]|uniref:Uncharacterized protein n=1 Tax=Thiomonas arsenitoxydans (strain DSM 22701 / CIP 110005 / 3As) TaxID=426114 RepID=D6CVU4_THIA3|nr:hypothetical protein [Thiomonas arsenitoxydans]CAZ90433.1 hypothetical protein THI_p0037 [Thiomonas arsenitoxydans]CQR32668.1 conserved hypothetical protein [Thiomonas arsenitoxydans]CQR45714.1 conserved protein of unknown function [Thiomonas sp. CB3]